MKACRWFLLFCCLWLPLSGNCQNTGNRNQPALTRILFIFDASNSMWGEWQSDKKIHIANRLLSKMVDSLESYPDVQIALRVYGHQSDSKLHDCNDTKLEVPFSYNNFPRVKQKLKTLYPKGTTPIAQSLLACEKDFPPATGNIRNVVVLITDGIEECSGDPCAVSHALQRKGIILKPFIIGIGGNFETDLRCIGNYIDASGEADFDNALHVIIDQIFHPTTCQVSLLDQSGKPTETNVNMTFEDSYSHKIRYNLIHTMNTRGLPDTLLINPMPEYKITVHTLPPVSVDSIKLTPGRHNIIPIQTPQGSLQVKVVSGQSDRYRQIPIIVRQADSCQTINVQYFDMVDKYLVGKYDLEILCMPRLIIPQVKISQSTTTQIKIPAPGTAIVQKNRLGTGSLYVMRGQQLEWVYNLRDDDIQESILLQPGTYTLVFRARESNRTVETLSQTFVVRSNMTTTVQIPKQP
ncbi:MAG: VWA domain-containing protein [Bacteroidales bacterium]|nr:VWA domain-containing protein [Bacteroidales bacterium]